MKLTDDERKTLVIFQLEKAHVAIKQAEGNRSLAFWEVVANRLYYACFHAVSALLIEYGYSFKTHDGLVNLFGLNFVKTGLVDLSHGRFLSQLQTMREKGDYNCIYDVTEDDIIPMIEPAKLLITTVEQLINTRIDPIKACHPLLFQAQQAFFPFFSTQPLKRFPPFCRVIPFGCKIKQPILFQHMIHPSLS